MPSSRGSSWPRDQTHISWVSCIGRRVLYHECHLGNPILLTIQSLETQSFLILPSQSTCIVSQSPKSSLFCLWEFLPSLLSPALPSFLSLLFIPPSLPPSLTSFPPTSIYLNIYYVAGMVLKTENTTTDEKISQIPVLTVFLLLWREIEGKKVKYIVCYLVVHATEENKQTRGIMHAHMYILVKVWCVF